ncbi:MAG: helix-turn-helix transcriptional regulator [candidate division Zixibacteria bacterium]|nr:helix-turn-helix transcriptional regulator [candidate division Zixibacteria bacterium]MDH3936560.1 helix-turn-helix transcriptional regulator [candidate division Zixibacteria bacterium]MDH4033146.1 helix-turn-helix transcriptional regulator [candidate division Zixibacteria bacterium]
MSRQREFPENECDSTRCSEPGADPERQTAHSIKIESSGVQVPLGLLDSMNLCCAVVDATGCIVSANSHWQSVFGAVVDDGPSEPIWEVLSEGKGPLPSRVREGLRNLELGQTIDLGHSRPGKGSEVERTLTWKCSLTSARHSDECFYVVVGRDLTGEGSLGQALEDSQRDLAKSRLELKRKSIALQEVVATVEIEKQAVASVYEHNISRVVEPLLLQLKERCRDSERHSIEVLESCLKSVLSPSAVNLERVCEGLTSREIQICNMVRQGFATKQIASVLSLSNQTVQTHRKNIRRKLGIRSKRVSLEKSLKRLEQGTEDGEQ